MNYYITNEHRKVLGLKPVEKNWDVIPMKYNEYGTYFLFFDKDTIKKIINIFQNSRYMYIREDDVNYKTKENRSIVLPKTNRGKDRKLNYTTITSFNGEGTYFYIQCDLKRKKGKFLIGNYTTQKTFYKKEEFDCDSIQNWLDDYTSNCTKEDIKEIENFSNEKRVHIKYKEGDYFRIKLDKNLYTYGRILTDIYKRHKKGENYWYVFMGRALLIETFHILTNRKDVSIEELEMLKTFPSQYIMDNKFYYGEYEIIGNKSLPEDINYPIMYGRSINAKNLNTIIFQCGFIHKEIPYTGNNLIKNDIDKNSSGLAYSDFKNNSIGWSFQNDIETIKKCIKENSNNPYWEHYEFDATVDLRSPQNKNKRKQVLKQMDVIYLLDKYKEE